MSEHIKQQVVEEFFGKKVLLSMKTAESRQRDTLFLTVAQRAVQNNRESGLKQVTEVRIQWQSISF